VWAARNHLLPCCQQPLNPPLAGVTRATTLTICAPACLGRAWHQLNKSPSLTRAPRWVVTRDTVSGGTRSRAQGIRARLRGWFVVPRYRQYMETVALARRCSSHDTHPNVRVGVTLRHAASHVKERGDTGAAAEWNGMRKSVLFAARSTRDKSPPLRNVFLKCNATESVIRLSVMQQKV